MSNSKEEVIEIPVGKFFGKLKGNPWMISTLVLGLLFLGSLVFGFNSGAGIVSEKIVGDNVVDFWNSRVEGGGVELNSVSLKGGYYEVVVDYQGQSIPFYSTLDGKNLITELVPVDGSSSPNNPADPSQQGSGRVDVQIPEDAHVKGNPGAPVTLIEFSDFQCPYCEGFYTNTLPEIEKNYIDTGKVKLVYLHYPLDFHPNAFPAAEAAECAAEIGGENAFWAMHDMMFENQQFLGRQNYVKWAGEIGLDSGRFEDCLDSGKYKEKINSEFAYGVSAGVTGTPGFFVNGIPVTGAQPYNVFDSLFNQELAR